MTWDRTEQSATLTSPPLERTFDMASFASQLVVLQNLPSEHGVFFSGDIAAPNGGAVRAARVVPFVRRARWHALMATWKLVAAKFQRSCSMESSQSQRRCGAVLHSVEGTVETVVDERVLLMCHFSVCQVLKGGS